jgi:integrase
MNHREQILARQKQIKAKQEITLAPAHVVVTKPPRPKKVKVQPPPEVKTSRQTNHPAKGSVLRVDPITDLKKIEAIKWLLRDKPRDLALFTVGINTNLRASDLIRITAGQVRNLKPMEEITLKEQKTGKIRRINLNSACTKAINAYLRTVNLPDDYPIFGMTVSYMSRLVRGWCEAANCKGRFASHSLRKTWARMQFQEFKTPLPVMMQILNHCNERITLSYMSIQPEEIRAAYANEL